MKYWIVRHCGSLRSAQGTLLKPQRESRNQKKMTTVRLTIALRIKSAKLITITQADQSFRVNFLCLIENTYGFNVSVWKGRSQRAQATCTKIARRRFRVI